MDYLIHCFGLPSAFRKISRPSRRPGCLTIPRIPIGESYSIGNFSLRLISASERIGDAGISGMSISRVAGAMASVANSPSVSTAADIADLIEQSVVIPPYSSNP
jgi:hypothetical protein